MRDRNTQNIVESDASSDRFVPKEIDMQSSQNEDDDESDNRHREQRQQHLANTLQNANIHQLSSQNNFLKESFNLESLVDSGSKVQLEDHELMMMNAQKFRESNEKRQQDMEMSESEYSDISSV